MSANIPHPIPYQGSKRKLARAIVSRLPDDTQRLIEPFAGSGAVSINAAYFGKAKGFVLNDINAPLLALWQQIIHQPALISAQYRTLWEAQRNNEKAYYNFVRSEFNRTHEPHYFLYLLARCVKAAVRYNANGEFNQSPDNRRKGTNPDTLSHHIHRTSRLLKDKVTLSSSDYRDSLQDICPGDVVYLDPPYQGVSGNRDPRYVQNLALETFVKALQDLNDRGISYIVSYDGRTGTKVHGQRLPESLNLQCVELDAGRSSQATLLGRDSRTYESLYLSPALVLRSSNVLTHELL